MANYTESVATVVLIRIARVDEFLQEKFHFLRRRSTWSYSLMSQAMHSFGAGAYVTSE
jgi:hypothetical protein